MPSWSLRSTLFPLSACSYPNASVRLSWHCYLRIDTKICSLIINDWPHEIYIKYSQKILSISLTMTLIFWHFSYLSLPISPHPTISEGAPIGQRPSPIFSETQLIPIIISNLRPHSFRTALITDWTMFQSRIFCSSCFFPSASIE